jgi:hypothetical protein
MLSRSSASQSVGLLMPVFNLLSWILSSSFLAFFILLADNHLFMFCRAARAHTGVYLAARISECLHDYGIQKKVCFRLLFVAMSGTYCIT